MNNGQGSSQNSKSRNTSTRGSKRPSSDVKLITNDSATALIGANTTCITTREIALEHAAKTGLFVRTEGADAEILSDKLVMSLLYSAKRAQAHTNDQPTQDAVWTLHFLFELIRGEWRAKVTRLQTELATAKDEIQRLKDVAAWSNEASINANDVAAAVMTRIKPVIAQEFATRTGPNSHEAQKLDALHQRLSILDTTVKTVSASLEAVTANMAGKPSYAAAVAAHTHRAQDQYTGRPAMEQDAISRADMKEKRLLILADGTQQNVWLANKPSEHVAKALIGVKAAFEAHPPPEPLTNLEAVSPSHAFRAGKSGVVLSFASKEAVAWISSDEVWKTFVQHFQPGAKVRHRVHEILLRNLPVTYEPDAPDFIPALRDANSLPESWIHGARWMKPVARRSDTQRSAHVILAFRSPEAANEILDRGSLSIDSCVYRVERLLRDPARCAKCQRHGHFAEKCKNAFTCGNCAQEGHHANDCPNPGSPRCATCSLAAPAEAGHPAWARECPARLRALERLQQTYPEDYAIRFLTSNNADTVLPRRSAPLTNVSLHRAPAVASGAKKHTKDAGAEKPKKTKAPSTKASSRPPTPNGAGAPKPGGRRSRAVSAASVDSTASTGTKKGNQRQRRTSSSSLSVEAQLDAASTQDGTQ